MPRPAPHKIPTHPGQSGVGDIGLDVSEFYEALKVVAGKGGGKNKAIKLWLKTYCIEMIRSPGERHRTKGHQHIGINKEMNKKTQVALV